MKFKRAVEETPGVESAWKPDLDAAEKQHRGSLTPTCTNRLSGSVALEGTLREAHQNEHLWDYAIGYRIDNSHDKAYFVEFHRGKPKPRKGAHEPAETLDGVVDKMLEKKAWLVGWLVGKRLGELDRAPYTWVPVGGLQIRPNTPHAIRVQNAGIVIKHNLKLT